MLSLYGATAIGFFLGLAANEKYGIDVRKTLLMMAGAALWPFVAVALVITLFTRRPLL